MVPLCPWQEVEHKEYYVPVGNTKAAFDEFTREMDDSTNLQRGGHLVLVTGESGCGKSALVNRCAWHAREKLPEQGLNGVVVDLRSILNGRPQLSVEERLAVVCDQLFVELKSRGALRKDALDDLEGDRTLPDRIYPNLPDALQQNTALVVLLPTSDLPDEVIRYGNLARRKIFFMIEYALLDSKVADDVINIVKAMEQWAPPITLRVSDLKPGDARRFAEDRLRRHSGMGIYPRMSRKTMDSLAHLLRSVGQLQSALHGTYDARLRNGLRYDENSFVTYKDIAGYILNELRDGQRRRS